MKRGCAAPCGRRSLLAGLGSGTTRQPLAPAAAACPASSAASRWQPHHRYHCHSSTRRGGVTASAVLHAPRPPSPSRGDEAHAGAASSLDTPAAWLERSVAAGAQGPAAGGSDARPSQPQPATSAGQYLGVFEGGQRQQAQQQAQQQQAPQSGGRTAPGSRPQQQQPRRRQASRSARHGRLRRLRQFGSAIEQHEAELTAWLHEQEDAFLALMASGASSRDLEQRGATHDQLLRRQMSGWQQRWGPPVGRTNPLQQAGQAQGRGGQQQQQQQQQQHQDQQQQQQHQDQQQADTQQEAPPTAAVASPPPVHADELEPPTPEASEPRLLQALAGEQPAQRTPRRAGSSGDSGSSAQQQQPRRASALDIPDTPQALAAAAAATERAGRLQRWDSGTVSASMVVRALAAEPMDTETLDQLEIVFLHLAMPRLVAWKQAHLLPKLASYVLSRPDTNEHTCGALFNAYALANRLDLALSAWDALSSAGHDIGPFGASALIKACAMARDVPTALQVFDQLLRRRVTFNAYTYNCLLQLCGSAGCMEDALAVYNLQRLETEPANLPDGFTYTALMRAVLVSGRVELTQQIFENMVEDGVAADPRLYTNYVTAAGRAGNLGLARYLYQHMAASLELPAPRSPEQQAAHAAARALRGGGGGGGGEGQAGGGEGQAGSSQGQAAAQEQDGSSSSSSSSGASSSSGGGGSGCGGAEDGVRANVLMLVNSLLFAHAQVGALQGALAVYRQELLGRGLAPDAYTATALLTAAARTHTGQLSWAEVADVAALLPAHGIALTTQLGTALINAYRRVRVWQRPAARGAGEPGGGGGSKARAQRVGRGRRRSSSSSPEGEADALAEASASELPADAAADAAAQAPAAWEAQQLASLGVTPVPGLPGVVAASLAAAGGVLDQLACSGLATSNSFVTMLCFLLEQGQGGGFRRVFAAMLAAGVRPDEQGWDKLASAGQECGLAHVVAACQAQLAGARQRPPQQQRQQQPAGQAEQ